MSIKWLMNLCEFQYVLWTGLAASSDYTRKRGRCVFLTKEGSPCGWCFSGAQGPDLRLKSSQADSGDGWWDPQTRLFFPLCWAEWLLTLWGCVKDSFRLSESQA